jgi:hypothetical protein
VTRISAVRRRVAISVGTAVILLFAVSSAGAGPLDAAESGATEPAKVATAGHIQATSPTGQSAAKLSRHYAIEFRARAAKSYGHAYVIYGPVNSGGKFIKGQIAGIHPATESVVPWMIGHLVPVPSETGASDGDNEDIYTTARYRIMLTEPEYRKVSAFIANLKKTSPSWHAVFYNCVSFIKDIAVSMNLRTPAGNVTYPEVFVNNMREMNTRPDGEAVTSVPYGQWGIERPAEEKSDKPAGPASKRKTAAGRSASATQSAPAAQPAPVVSAVTPLTAAPQ